VSLGIILASALPASGEICPMGWISTITGCYKIIDSFTWTEGEINCKKAGGFLAEINSQEEQDTLWRVYQDSGLSLDHVYIGATDVAQEGTWLWVHSGTELTFTAWYSWEPNGGTRENCLIASTIPNGNFKWNDIPCDLRYEKSKAICESDRTVFPIPGCSCSDHTETAHRDKVIGQCVDKLQGKEWCYVENGVDSTCPDKKPSRRSSSFWSFVACQWYDVYVPIKG